MAMGLHVAPDALQLPAGETGGQAFVANNGAIPVSNTGSVPAAASMIAVVNSGNNPAFANNTGNSLAAVSPAAATKKGWVSLFDGKSLNGWKVGENAGTFSVENGAIVVHGPRAHLFYVGDAGQHNFRNFEFEAKVKTTPGSNSGIYFHTAYQEKGWPEKGFEVQVNNSHTDWKRTSSLYDIKDIREVHAADDVWYTQYIRVQGKTVTLKVNGKTVLEYTEPEHTTAPQGHAGRVIDRGTFALQGHDPKSKVYFKDLKVRQLPD